MIKLACKGLDSGINFMETLVVLWGPPGSYGAGAKCGCQQRGLPGGKHGNRKALHLDIETRGECEMVKVGQE